jgi:uncharacterized membrane protein YhaH (DUF805 family)
MPTGGKMDWQDYLFGFEGRIGRGQFWSFALFLIPYAVAAALIAHRLADNWLKPDFVFMLPAYYPAAAIAVKRLHDRDRSFRLAILFIAVPLLDNFVRLWLPAPPPAAGQLPQYTPQMALELVNFAVALWALFELGVYRGTKGANRYGPDPLA